MKIKSIYGWVAALLLFIALAGVAYLGLFTRFHADDFCMAADAGQIGLVGMLGKWYTTWTGRFSFILGTGLFGLAGPGFAGWVPVLAEAIWLAGLSWAILPLVRKIGWQHPRLLAVMGGGLGLLVLLSSTPNLFQSFYWQDGFVNYSLPLIGLTFILGVILRVYLDSLNPWGAAAAVFLMALVCGGFTEAYTAMQIAIAGVAIAAIYFFGDRTHRRASLMVSFAVLVGGVLALLVVVAAPGNQVRLGAVGDHPGIFRIVTFSMRNAAYIFGKFFIKTPLWAFLSVSVPFLAGWMFYPNVDDFGIDAEMGSNTWRKWLVRLLLLGLAGFMLVVAACAPVVYALDAYPDDRTIIVPLFVVVLTIIGGSVLVGTVLRRMKFLPDPRERPALGRVIQIAMLTIVLLSSGFSIWQTARQVPDYQAYAQTWDQRAAEIQQAAAAGETDVTVPGLNARFGVADLNASPDNWVNRCMAYYYKITNLSGR